MVESLKSSIVKFLPLLIPLDFVLLISPLGGSYNMISIITSIFFLTRPIAEGLYIAFFARYPVFSQYQFPLFLYLLPGILIMAILAYGLFKRKSYAWYMLAVLTVIPIIKDGNRHEYISLVGGVVFIFITIVLLLQIKSYYK